MITEVLGYVRAALRDFIPNLRYAVSQAWTSQEGGGSPLMGRMILLACAFLMLTLVLTTVWRAVGGELKALLSFVEIVIFLPVALKALIAWIAQDDVKKPNRKD